MYNLWNIVIIPWYQSRNPQSAAVHWTCSVTPLYTSTLNLTSEPTSCSIREPTSVPTREPTSVLTRETTTIPTNTSLSLTTTTTKARKGKTTVSNDLIRVGEPHRLWAWTLLLRLRDSTLFFSSARTRSRSSTHTALWCSREDFLLLHYILTSE